MTSSTEQADNREALLITYDCNEDCFISFSFLYFDAQTLKKSMPGFMNKENPLDLAVFVSNVTHARIKLTLMIWVSGS